jgi:cation diffusion facilitator family transporter
MSELRSRAHSTQKEDKTKENGKECSGHTHSNGEADGHSHSHQHSLFGHSHSHEGGSAGHGADQIMAALQSSGDRGSRVTLVGLFSNVALTGAKGAAGFYMHSASLMADAAHSMSDLLGDFVTLFCWKLSRKQPTDRYPFGFAKFETLGTTTVSLLLIGGALGIGFHSFHLLGHALGEAARGMESGALQTILTNATAITQSLPDIGHSHDHVDVLDPNAAWFAGVSVIAKEWLYRITKKVADEEHSPVLLANAIHHRSDAYSSMVALVAILGTSIFPHIPLDPIGGILVSFVILQQGISILTGAYGDLVEASVSPATKKTLHKSLQPLLSTSDSSSHSHEHTHSHSHAEPLQLSHRPILSINNLRARWSGSTMLVDLTVGVDSTITVKETSDLERRIEEVLKEARKEVSEVRVRFRPVV